MPRTRRPNRTTCSSGRSPSHGDGSTSAGRIDLYRRGAFVLESKKLKQGAHTKGFDDAMLRARSQAENYARALPADEGRPPFVIVVDVGHRIELYSEFSRSGGTYVPFPEDRADPVRVTWQGSLMESASAGCMARASGADAGGSVMRLLHWPSGPNYDRLSQAHGGARAAA